VIDRLGVFDTVKDINSINLTDPANIAANAAKLQSLINTINRPGASVSAIGAGSVYIKGYYGDHAFGINISDVATGGELAEGARFSETIGRLSRICFIPKGITRFKTHDDANRHWDTWLAKGMAALAATRLR
jgi:hypothetical protein